MKAGIVYRNNKKNRKMAEDVKNFLELIGVCTRLFTEPKSELECFDFIVSIGGDGTILRILQHLRSEVPIFGINTGRVGIFTHTSSENFKSALKRAIESFEVEKFHRLSCIAGDEELLALNEIAIFGRNATEIIEAKISIDGKFLDVLRCKAVIIATPVGSTAYSLSAGGPVVDPYTEVMILTALIPLRAWRPIVLKMDRRIRVEAEGVVIADGQKRVCAEVAEIKKSEYPAVFFKKERIPEVFMKIRTVS